MILPNYEEIITNDSKKITRRIVRFDKVWVHIFGDAKYRKTELFYRINPGYRRRNANPLEYMRAMNDYFITHPCWKQYNEKRLNVFDPDCIRTIDLEGFKITKNEFQLMSDQYPNLFVLYTNNCTIYKEASIGSLKCYYTDYNSDIMSLDSLNGFAGKKWN